jgi:hypothetical protein
VLSGSLLFTPENTPLYASVRALIIHQFSAQGRTKDSLYEKKFTTSIDIKNQSCVNGNQVSYSETMFTKKVVAAVYFLGSRSKRHGSGG